MADNSEFFESKYEPGRVRAGRRIEEVALGQSVGLNGYTTVVEAETLCTHLDLETTALLLDVGSGQGWPGSHIARMMGCRLVSVDVPWNALLTAKTQTGTAAVRADGGSLPFRDDSFDAIVHADVFC